jgi:hypothetical protein
MEPAYITIVEGPPPRFHEVSNVWAIGVLDGTDAADVAFCEMRTLNGPVLVKRCEEAWNEGRPARLDFPTEDGIRGELDIIATRWEKVEEGQKLYLWVRT